MTQFVCKDLTRGEENAILKMVGDSATIRKILSGELKIELLSTSAQTVVVQAIKKPTSTFLCSEAFVTKSGRYVYDSFRHRITPAYPNRLCRRSIKKVKYHNLEKDSSDRGDIIPSLGGMDKVRKNAFRPDEIDSLMEAQAKGQKGPLLTNDYANVFYVIGVNGELFAVDVSWVGDEWSVDAYALDEDGSWNAGCRVFRKR